MGISTKNKMLLAGIMIMMFISYQFSIKKTIDTRREYLQLKSEYQKVNDLPKRLSVLIQKEKHYDSILSQMDIGNTSVQNNLLRIINREAEDKNVKVMAFNKPHIDIQGQNQYYTYSFILNGNYADILKVIHPIEQKGNFGEIVHTDFQKKKDYRTRKLTLEATVFVQQLR